MAGSVTPRRREASKRPGRRLASTGFDIALPRWLGHNLGALESFPKR